EFLRLNRPFSLLGLPSLSVPIGADRNGIPVGMQVVGPPHGDESVIALAEWLKG
ncbi:MAG: amidase, partial [Bauldia sp.]